MRECRRSQINLDISLRGNGLIYLVGCLSAIIFSGFYIYWWRDKQRARNPVSSSKDYRYTPIQIGGAVCIVIFLVPIFYGVASNLFKGLFTLILIFLRIIHIPEFIISLIMYILVPIGVFGIIIGTYHVCSLIWPKKKEQA